MGYYTKFEIKAYAQKWDTPGWQELVSSGKSWVGTQNKSDYNDRYIAKMEAAAKAYLSLTEAEWDEIEYAMGNDESKFYGWRGTMTKLSTAYPDHLFHVTWWGEEAGDYGEAEFYQGKSREVKAILPPLPDTWT